MALDFFQKVITEYRADTKDHIAGLQKLKTAITDTQKADLDAAQKRDETYDKWLGRLASVNQALELGGKAIGIAKDAFKSYSEDMRLRAAAGAVSIDKLKAASMGLRTEQELLSFAAKTQHGIIKLNSDQMETAQRAMVALTRAGFDQEEVTKKVTDALVKAKAEGLDDFGLSVKQGKTEVETFNNVMQALSDKAAGVQSGSATAGESIQKMGVSMGESFEKMKQALGQLVTAMAPLLNALARAVGLVADLAKGHMDVQEAGGQGGYIAQKVLGLKADNRTGFGYATDETRGLDALASFNAQIDAARGTVGGAAASRAVNAFAEQFQKFNASEQAKIEATATGVAQGIMGVLTGAGNAATKGVSKGIGGKTLSDSEIQSRALQAARMQAEAILHGATGGGGNVALDQGLTAGTWAALNPEGPFGQKDLGLGKAAAGGEIDNETFQKILGVDPETLTAKWFEGVEKARSGRESFLEGLFGKPEEFDLYRQLFDGFTEAVGGMYEALVTGSDSAGKVFKKMIADQLMAIGKQEAALAIKEAAWSVGDLAYGNFAGAAAHAKSAALHGAAAVAAGVAAHSLGTSAQVAASEKAAADKQREEDKAAKGSGSSGGSRSSGGSGGSDGLRPIYVMLGSAFDETSPRQRRVAARDAVDRALRERDES